MTLIVSLRIPDGIVIAGDSLSTMMQQNQVEVGLDITCPKCNHQHKVQEHIPIPATPATTFSYAQKVFPFCDKFGVGTFGIGVLTSKSVYFAIRLLEQKLTTEGTLPDTVTEAANKIGDYVHELLKSQLKLEGSSTDQLPSGGYPLGFQVVGYDDDKPIMLEVFVGKTVDVRVQEQLGCTYSGSGEVVKAIWQLYEKDPQSRPPYPVFSLQDAINYADFLIQTTISHQRFSQKTPTVGGDVDIALVTPFDGFRWIRQKPLLKILEGDSK